MDEVQLLSDIDTVTNLSKTSLSPQSFAWIMIGILVVLIIMKFVIEIARDLIKNKKKKGIQKTHSLKNLRDLAIKQDLEEFFVERANIKKQYKTVSMCQQAGLNITYGEFCMIRILLAIILPILAIIILKNVYLALILIFIGLLLPGQIISFMRNRRIAVLERQLESFMKLFAERYKTVPSPSAALQGCLKDFEGQEPICYEIKKTLLDINLGMTNVEALNNFADRTGNKYWKQMVDSVRIAEDIGTHEIRTRLISRALEAYRKKKTRYNNLKQRIQGPKNESMMLLGAVPGVMVYQAVTSDSYVDFMTNTQMGKIGLAIIAVNCLLALWFINKKIGAPLE